MGSTKPGWAAARLLIVLCNILGHDIVFLQEVQWVERSLQKVLTFARAGYELVMTSNEHNNRNTCILYNPERLQCAKEDTEAVTATLKSVSGWTDDYSKRVCLHVFSLRGKGDAPPKFAAISLHAPKGIQDNQSFCGPVKDAIERIVAHHNLPVLVGGDFNSDIYRWKVDGFQGLDYEAGRSPIDFITMKVPGSNNHLTIGKVQKMKCEEIKINNAEDIQVEFKDGSKTNIKDCKDKAADNLCRHVCGSHMPLTVPVLYRDNVISTEGDKDDIKTWEELVEENARLKEELKRFTLERKRKQHQPETTKKKLKCEYCAH